MPVIVISGMPVTGSSTTARNLSKKLGLRSFSAGDFFKSHSLEKTETKKALSFLDTKEGSSTAFHNALDEKVSDECRKGDVVVDTKLGVRLSKGHYDYSVWIKAGFNVRAARVAKRDSIPIEQAKAELREKESKERKLWKQIYGFDYFSQEDEADLVVDNSNIGPDKVVEIIMESLRKERII